VYIVGKQTARHQAAALRQIADDLERDQCPPGFLAALLAAILGDDDSPPAKRGRGGKKSTPRKRGSRC